MEFALYGSGAETPTVYDYRLYDRIWQRVSPELNPYPEVRAAAAAEEAAARASGLEPVAAAVPAPLPETEEGGALHCMGLEATASLAVLTGAIREEITLHRWAAAMAHRCRERRSVQQLRQIAGEHAEAQRRLRAAYYLAVGSCYSPADGEPAAEGKGLSACLRTLYHREARAAEGYDRAAGEMGDLCLQRLFASLAEGGRRRGEVLLDLLGRIIC